MFIKKYYLLIIILIALFLRLYDLNWDQNYHLHPDEREITLVTMNLHLPDSPIDWRNLLTPVSPLNPKFFAYGSLPIYLLFFLSRLTNMFNYDNLTLLGRFLSALFDVGTLLTVYFLGKKIVNRKVGIIAAFFYAISVLPIQLSHFYAVDTLLTFFVTFTLLSLINFYQKPSPKKAVLIGILLGLSLATKISSVVLLVPIFFALTLDFALIFLKSVPQKSTAWLHHLPQAIRKLLLEGLIIIFCAGLVFVVAEPFAIIDFPSFYAQNMQQEAMTKDAFVFPYTLQYVGITPYVYELKNIFLWGLGPILTVSAFAGGLYVTIAVVLGEIKNTNHSPRSPKLLILLSFFWVYFLIVGSFAIGFMRYMLPIYPLLALFAAILSWTFSTHLSAAIKSFSEKIHYNLSSVNIIIYSLFFILLLIWPTAFMHIYSQDNARVQATSWIVQNIPFRKKIAVEHWDDELPLGAAGYYRMLTLPMYDPETVRKWQTVNNVLNQTDYIIIASNRLYVPLQKLTDCSHLPPGRCYPQTALYYQKLFNGSLGFQKVAEFSIHPQLSIWGWNLSIDDNSADESFTVYDHPRVMIFKKI